jgi:hypothetical protein
MMALSFSQDFTGYVAKISYIQSFEQGKHYVVP